MQTQYRSCVGSSYEVVLSKEASTNLIRSHKICCNF